MPVVNGMRSSPASSCMRRRTAGSLSGAYWCAMPFPRRRGLVDSSIRPIDAFQRRSAAISAWLRMPAFVCGSMPPSTATRQPSTRYSAVLRKPCAREPLAMRAVRDLRLVAEAEQRLDAARRDAAAHHGRDLVERVRVRLGRVRRLREGAVRAAVATQVGERDEDVARDGDAIAPRPALALGRGLEQRLEHRVVGEPLRQPLAVRRGEPLVLDGALGRSARLLRKARVTLAS